MCRIVTLVIVRRREGCPASNDVVCVCVCVCACVCGCVWVCVWACVGVCGSACVWVIQQNQQDQWVINKAHFNMCETLLLPRSLFLQCKEFWSH